MVYPQTYFNIILLIDLLTFSKVFSFHRNNFSFGIHVFLVHIKVNTVSASAVGIAVVMFNCGLNTLLDRWVRNVPW